MSKILAIETSTEACSCALLMDGAVSEVYELVPRQHAKRLLPMINRLMQDHSLSYYELDAVGVGQGPGSFTGLRIAAGVAQGIAFGADIPLIPISTLSALAMQASQVSTCENIISCIDARINEVYWGVFTILGNKPVPTGSEHLCKPELINNKEFESSIGYFGAGNGFKFLDEMNTDLKNKIIKVDSTMLPKAREIAFLANLELAKGNYVDPSKFSPVYLRDKVTHG